MDGIRKLIERMLAECESLPAEEMGRFHPRAEIGKCPVCGSPVYEGKKNFTADLFLETIDGGKLPPGVS